MPVSRHRAEGTLTQGGSALHGPIPEPACRSGARAARANWDEAGLTPKAQSHSASLHNLRGAPTGAQARSGLHRMSS